MQVKNAVTTSTELSTHFASLPVGNASEPIAFTGNRSLACQAVDPRNLDEMYNVGVIKYSSTSKPLGTKLRRSKKRLSTCKVEQQIGRTQLPHNRIHNAAGGRLMPGRTDEPDIQKLPVCEHKQDVHEHQKARNETDYIKINIMSVKGRQRSVEAASDPSKLPSTYQRGVFPKYLIKRREAMQKEA
jgi:hypothetical protein